ncbi:Beta-1,3-glucan-binding protein [Orchesella cincta]|uniref:Beta-1,3-glucan-binding protein n=1 Tax=Orchesella cincta TaxID=48709 RepID=A0A1D2MT80_ORCCI|nr:Beta-1,3-glucan-binding protein [Orchesella cincta]
MAGGDWIEPVISLLPAEKFYGEDLRSGQIHLVDTRGNRNLFNENGIHVGSEQTCPDIRFGTGDNRKVEYYCLNTAENQGFDRDFHLYELEWTPDSITLKIDDEGVFSTPFPRPNMYKLWSGGREIPNPWEVEGTENPKLAPFDKEFYLAIGVKVGGISGFFSDDYSNRPYSKPWKNTDTINKSLQSFWVAGEH